MLSKVGVDLAAAEMPQVDHRVGQGFERVVQFAGSDSGGERAAAMYSLIGSCKLNDINPRAYLEYVLTHIADYPIPRIDELLPWNVAARLATPGSPPAAVV